RIREMQDYLVELQRLLTGIKEPHFDAGALADIARRIQSTQSALSALDLSATTDLEEQLKLVKQELATLKTENKSDEESIYRLKSSLKHAQDEMAAIEANKQTRLDAWERQIGRVKALSEANPAVSYAVVAQAVEMQLNTPGLTVDAVRSELDALS